MKKVSKDRICFGLLIGMALAANVFLTGCSTVVNKSADLDVDNLTEGTEIQDNIAGIPNISTEYPDEKLSQEDGEGNTSQSKEEVIGDVTDDEALESTESKYRGPEISIIMIGDMLMHTPVEESSLQEDGSYSFDAIFANTSSEIEKASLAIVNQEVIIAGESMGISGYPAFNAPFELGHDLVEVGFDVICHGTNHALDQGKKGLKKCLAFWEENYPEIAVLGIHGSQADQDEIYIYEQDGVKIAVLNFTYGTNGIALPSDMPYAVDMLEEAAVVEALDKANELADFTIVCPHWGNEYELGTTSQQKKWVDIFWEHGVDLVIGTHPHVIEPIEQIVDEETGQTMLVYYSIGNYVSWTSSSGAGVSNRMVGGMAQITLGVEEETGEVFVLEYGVDPVVCHLTEGVNGVTTYFLEDYSPELAAINEIRKQDESFSYEYCVELCDKVWGDLWRTGSAQEER